MVLYSGCPQLAWNTPLDRGDPIGEIADYLQYSEGTVRAKMRELGLEERPS
jgi:hypothetical protein